MKKTLLLLCAFSFLLTSCDLFNSYGKKVKINDKSDVYYKGDGVTESDAKKLGDYLLAIKYFDDSNAKTIQLTKDNNAYVARFVINQDKYNQMKDQLALPFWFMQDLLSENVFNGQKTKIILTDTKLKDIQALDDVNKVKLSSGGTAYYKDGATEEEVKKLGGWLSDNKFFDYTNENAVLITKKDGEFNIHFMANDAKAQNQQQYIATLQNWQYLIGKYGLGGEHVQLHLLAPSYVELQKIQDPSDALKQQLDQAMQNPQQNDQNGYDQTQYQQQNPQNQQQQYPQQDQQQQYPQQQQQQDQQQYPQQQQQTPQGAALPRPQNNN